jgi:protein transport protein SEC24
LEQAQMLVVSDIDDMFTPIKEGLLVDPVASKTVIESLLDTLPTMFQANRTADPVLGAALQAAHRAMEANGGRLIVFQTMLPIRGPGTIQTRDDNKLINTDKEYQLFTPQGAFYKDIAEKMVEAGVCVDLFLFPNAPVDLATIGKFV